MAWWEGQLKKQLRELPPDEVERIVGDAIRDIDAERFMAMARALKAEGIRRGFIGERQPA